MRADAKMTNMRKETVDFQRETSVS